MNRQQRRAEAAKARVTSRRHAAVEGALAYMAASDDPTITGATLILPDGETLFVPANAARAMKQKSRRVH